MDDNRDARDFSRKVPWAFEKDGSKIFLIREYDNGGSKRVEKQRSTSGKSRTSPPVKTVTRIPQKPLQIKVLFESTGKTGTAPRTVDLRSYKCSISRDADSFQNHYGSADQFVADFKKFASMGAQSADPEADESLQEQQDNNGTEVQADENIISPLPITPRNQSSGSSRSFGPTTSTPVNSTNEKRRRRSNKDGVPFSMTENKAARFDDEAVDPQADLKEEVASEFIAQYCTLPLENLVTGQQAFRPLLKRTHVDSLKEKIKGDGFAHFGQIPVVYVEEEAESFKERWADSRQGETAEEILKNEQAFLGRHEYIVLGGQHLVTALQQIKEEKALESRELTNQDTEIMCSVYGDLSDASKAFLSHKHQGAGQNCAEIFFQDYIALCRKTRKDFVDEHGRISKKIWKENFFTRYPIDDVMTVRSKKKDRNALLMHLAQLSEETWRLFTKWLRKYEGPSMDRKEFKPTLGLKWSGVDDDVLQGEFTKLLRDSDYTLEKSQRHCASLKKVGKILTKVVEFSRHTSEDLFSLDSPYGQFYTAEALEKAGLLRMKFSGAGWSAADKEIQRYVATVEGSVSGEQVESSRSLASRDKVACGWFHKSYPPKLAEAKEVVKDVFKGTNMACFQLLSTEVAPETLEEVSDVISEIYFYNNQFSVQGCHFLFIASPLQLRNLWENLFLFAMDQVPKMVDFLFPVVEGEPELETGMANFIITHSTESHSTGMFWKVLTREQLEYCTSRYKEMTTVKKKTFRTVHPSMADLLAYLIDEFSCPHDMVLDVFSNGAMMVPALSKNRFVISFVPPDCSNLPDMADCSWLIGTQDEGQDVEDTPGEGQNTDEDPDGTHDEVTEEGPDGDRALSEEGSDIDD